jgi:hypothetical protein
MRLYRPPTNKFTIEHMWLVFDHLIAGRPVIYYSCPISTGKRFIDWWQQFGHALPDGDYQIELLNCVIQPNRIEAERLFNMAALNTDVSHVCPAEIDFTAWSHEECMQFWLRFFEQQIISEVVCLSDWAYSLGCVMEYHAARKHNLSVRELDNCIHLAKVLADMADCMELMQHAGIDFSRYKEEYQQLQRLIAK